MMVGLLQGKVVLITGGNGGIGSATVSLLGQQNAKVAVLDVPDSGVDSGDSQMYIKCNIASEKEVDEAVSKVIARWGRLDVLINCAGVMDKREGIAEVSNEVWERCLAINLTGPKYLMCYCIPQFLKQDTKGVIVDICSTASIRGPAVGAAYTATKHALLGLSRSTAWMCAKDGIRCNSVLPGRTNTDILKNSGVTKIGEGGTRLGLYLQCIPDSYQPGDIANAVLFLATAPAVNGAELAVDRGWTSA